MSMLNSVILTGRITADLELQKKNDSKYLNCSIATEDGYGENKYTNFFRITAFNKTAENLINGGVKKGSYIWIRGALRQSVYEKNGQKQNQVGIILNAWGYCGYSENSTGQQSTSAGAPPAPVQNTAQASGPVPPIPSPPAAAPSAPPAGQAQPQPPAAPPTPDFTDFSMIDTDDDLPF